MDLNAVQSETVITLFSATLQVAASEEELTRTLKKLENEFGGTIPDWEDLLRRKLRAERLIAEEAALDKYLEEKNAPAVLPETAPKPRVERVYVGRDNRTDEEIAASYRDYCQRRLKYVFLTAFANSLYQKEKISLERYQRLENVFAAFYGFDDSLLARRDKPPEGCVFVHLHKRRRKRKAYTQHTPEYWKRIADFGEGDERHD